MENMLQEVKNHRFAFIEMPTTQVEYQWALHGKIAKWMKSYNCPENTIIQSISVFKQDKENTTFLVVLRWD